jgi:uncharacterized repeat protein (TIGR03803 family)
MFQPSQRFVIGPCLRSVTGVLSVGFMLALLANRPAQAQTFTVLHAFTGGADGGHPFAGLTMDKAGNFYGTTFGVDHSGNCDQGCGSVFKLSPKGPGWVFTPLYVFKGGFDGANPWARVVIGPDGSLYGTTYYGGGNVCYYWTCGTVFNLKPPPTRPVSVLSPWNLTVLHSFSRSVDDGRNPRAPALVFDQAGSLYGTTLGGGPNDYGTLCRLTPSSGGWTLSILYGVYAPYSGMIFDNAGNLYGALPQGGSFHYGEIFQLAPSGSGWELNSLYDIVDASDGLTPMGGVIFDSAGNLYGTTSQIGLNGGGTVFQLTPANGQWTFKLLYAFSGTSGPYDSLIMDSAGSLYGTTSGDGTYNKGSVFKLTPSANGWTYTSLHDFTGGTDGCWPYGNVVMDANGVLYGTASGCGANNHGVIFEITP